VLVAAPAASERRRLARAIHEGGYDAMTAPDRPSAASVLRSGTVAAMVCTVALVETSAGLDELISADADVQIVLGAPPHDAALAAAMAYGRACTCFELPLIHDRWLHVLVDRAVAYRQLLDRLRATRSRDSGAP
jgi:DNA-binding NtrC family response regulator